MSKLAAVGLLFAIILVSYGLLVSPLIDRYAAVDDQLADTLRLLQRYESAAANVPELEREKARLLRAIRLDSRYLPGETDSMTAAALQQVVTQVATQSQARLRSIQVLPPVEDGKFNRIAVRVQMEAPLRSLFDVLYVLETRDETLFVDQVDVRNPQSRLVKTPRTGETPLTIKFDVYGFRPLERTS